MKERIVLKGLRPSDYIHPRELELQSSVMNSPEIKKMIEMVSDVNLRINKTRVQGTYIRLTPQTAPRVFGVLKDVCRILDYTGVPEIYVVKMLSSSVVPCISEKEYIVITDYVLEQYDEEMLYFAFGNAISMMMCGHAKLSTAAAYMGCNIWTALPQIKFKEYLHAADATSDRGGLLACQSLAAATRCHLMELGIPPCITRDYFSTDEEAGQYIENYLWDMVRKNDLDRGLTKIGEWWLNLNAIDDAASKMMLEMYIWYRKEYPALLERFRGGMTQ